MTLDKRPVKWHEERLMNMIAYLVRKNEELAMLERSRNELADDITRLQKKINFAKAKNIESFDEKEARMRKL